MNYHASSNPFGRGSRLLRAKWLHLGFCLIAAFFTVLALVPLTATPALAAGPKVAVYGADYPSSTIDVKDKLASTGLFSQVDAFQVQAGNPVPTLAQLKQYDAVLVYSNMYFNDYTALGNVLADYMDAKGGVVIATFAFYAPGGPGIGGRVSSAGYLPFTLGYQSQGTPLTLVADSPSHPILVGVSSFNGGTSSYHNTIGLASGATLIAHWSNGRPLVATKQPTAGRVVGLNFFPPSSDVGGGFWVSSTNGARLMANALVWAAGLDTTPPVITPTVTGTMGTNGWYTSNVTVSWNVTDPESGIASSSGSGTTILTGDTSGTTLTCSAMNGAGLSNSVSITIKLDKTPPQLNLPPSAVLEATSSAGTVYIFPVTATDNFDPAPSVSCSPPSGSTFPVGTSPAGAPVTTTVNCTATDQAGNSTSGSFTVTVKDTTPPTLTVPRPITVEATTTGGILASAPQIQSWLNAASGVDLVDPMPSVTNDAPTLCPLGATAVTFKATDAQGNSSTTTSTVTVVDTTKPVLTIPADVTVEQATPAGTVVPLTATATDICDAAPVVTSDAPAIFPLGTTTVTFTATDKSSNKSTASMTVTVVDTTKPQVTLGTSVLTLWPPNHNMVNIGLALSVSDVCDANPTVVLSVTQDEKVDEDTGDGNFSPDAKILRDATGKITGLELRAERKGNGDGRVYLITVIVTDASGNVTMKYATVTVSQSQSKKDIDAVAAQAAAAVAAGVPLPYNSTAGPVIGPKQ